MKARIFTCITPMTIFAALMAWFRPLRIWPDETTIRSSCSPVDRADTGTHTVC